jgi:hypothetical protein
MTIPTIGARRDVPTVDSGDTPAMYVTCGSMLCELRVCTAAEWDTQENDENPIVLTYVPGLGWVGAVPILCMN